MKYLNDISYKGCVGKVCKSTSSGDFKILKYNDSKDVEIQFVNTGFKTTVQLGDIKIGNVKDPYVPSVFGVGLSRKFKTMKAKTLMLKALKKTILFIKLVKMVIE